MLSSSESDIDSSISDSEEEEVKRKSVHPKTVQVESQVADVDVDLAPRRSGRSTKRTPMVNAFFAQVTIEDAIDHRNKVAIGDKVNQGEEVNSEDSKDLESEESEGEELV